MSQPGLAWARDALLSSRFLLYGSVRSAQWPWLEAANDMAWQSCGFLPYTQDRSAGAPPPMPRIATRTPAPDARSIATARVFTQRILQKWGSDYLADNAAAVVTELMTNALQHGRPADGSDNRTRLSASPIRLGLADPGPYVICAVADSNPEPPTPRRPDSQDEAGRGLLVVAALSDQWGCAFAPTGEGKVVWAAFATKPRDN